MLAQLRADIKAKLEGAYPFRIVEPGFSQRALQSPPAAVFVLTKDGKVCDEPEVVRKLIYEIALLVNYTDPVKAQIEMESIIDVLRPALTQWFPQERGCEPATVEDFTLHGVDGTLLIYTAQMTLEVYPATLYN